MKHLLIILFVFTMSLSFAQSQSFQVLSNNVVETKKSKSLLKPFEITGVLTSEIDKTPLESATVYLQRVKDSALITYTISDSKGKFVLENKTNDKEANLFVSYIGFETFHKRVKIDKPIINLGNIILKESTNTLDAVLVKSQAPITIKKDTLEFNVKSFKTRKDANIEDLLKELPGVEVDANGQIKVNGKVVNKVLVNGKPFFGNDPTIATRNLSKEIIEKIQVSDTKTDAEAFAGQEGSGENKTVNLVIKKDHNKGMFGRLSAGAGTDKRYQMAGMYNQFNDDLRLSILSGGNNINEPGFSYGEIDKMFGGRATYDTRSQLFNYNLNGNIVSRNYGLNYVDDWGETVDASVSYFVSNTDNINETISERENILPDGRYFSSSSSTSNQSAEQHGVDSNFIIKIDSTLLITFRPQLRRINRINDFNSSESSFNEVNELINSSLSESFTETDENEFQNNTNITKRLGKNGSFLKFNVFNRFIQTDDENILDNEVSILGDSPETINLNQRRLTDNRDETFVFEAIYRLPLKAKELFLDVTYGYRDNTKENKRTSFDLNETTGQYEPTTNTAFNSDFEYANITSTPTLALEYKKKKWSTSIKTDFISRTLENKDKLRPEFDLKRKFNAAAVRYRLNYRSPKTSLNVRYNLNNNAPSLNQLQTFVDVTDPLNVVIGNPELKPETNHYINLYYRANDFQKGKNLYAYISSSIRNNDIISKRTISEDLVRETTYENVNGGYSLYGNLGYGKKIKIDSLKSINLNVGLNNNYRRFINYNNDVQYATLSKSFGPQLGVRFVWKDVTELGVHYNSSFTDNSFDIDSFTDQKFTVHNAYINTTNYINKSLEWRNTMRYNYNPNIADGFQKSAWFWNSTLAYSFMKDKATLTLKAYDLLNQNTNARRIVNQNFIEDRQSTVLQQYFMLSFSWKFNTLGKAGEVRGGRGYIVR
ncbi:outer membrane beta-barrel protein [Seonamhaeicola sp. MEBiC1930]|uniref:outer membrane beta-barrel protein n=1 Tax=Seonamhaeicola sp. MEBiC01930 TaxID=2976768 RepID=UPI0032462628